MRATCTGWAAWSLFLTSDFRRTEALRCEPWRCGHSGLPCRTTRRCRRTCKAWPGCSGWLGTCRGVAAETMAPSGPWSANKRVLMVHSSVATAIGFALIFAPAYLAAVGPAFVGSATQQAFFGGIFVLLGGLFCTVPDSPSVLKSVSMGFGTAALALTWAHRENLSNIGAVSVGDLATLAYLAVGTAAPLLLAGDAPKAGKKA